MDYMKRIRLASNSFYNAGLEQARRRDLTGAVICLQKCLNLNKYHIHARNLLGLIYYEMGEVSEALVQWVISMNIQERDNRADVYLEQIQRKPERLEVASQNVKRYNQALIQAQSGSDDLAVLSLTRVVEVNPKFVKAHLLLALLYISHDDYVKAGKSLYKVLKIDKNNPKASWYMSIVKARTGKAEIERKKLKNAFSHRRMQDDDVIIPPSYKENTGWQSVLNIGAGLLLGAAVIFFLVMPAKIKQLNNQHTQDILLYNEQLNQKNDEISSINNTIQTYLTDKETAEQRLDTLLNSNDSVLNQYSILVRMLQAYRTDNLTEAVTLYAGFNPDLFTEEEIITIANGLKQDIETNGYQTLEDLAYTMWSAGRMSEALNLYQTCLSIRPNSPNVIYNMGMINRAQNETETAVQLFTQVVTEHADSEYAARAQQMLAELVPQSQQTAAQGQTPTQESAAAEPSQAAGTGQTSGGNANSGSSNTGGGTSTATQESREETSAAETTAPPVVPPGTTQPDNSAAEQGGEQEVDTPPAETSADSPAGPAA